MKGLDMPTKINSSQQFVLYNITLTNHSQRQLLHLVRPKLLLMKELILFKLLLQTFQNTMIHHPPM